MEKIPLCSEPTRIIFNGTCKGTSSRDQGRGQVPFTEINNMEKGAFMNEKFYLKR